MIKVTISGHPGSGTTTLVQALSQHYGWSSLNGGQLFRDEAQRRGMTLADFGQLCKDDLEVDQSLDHLLKTNMIDEHAPEIIESRLAGWWAYQLELPCIRLWIEVDDGVRAQRVLAREGGELQEILIANHERRTIDDQRFMSLYGLIPQDPTPYTHIIDASTLTIDEVKANAIQIMEEFL